MECIAVINQKGGVGKTATTVNLGVALARRGKRALLIDLDPQAHLTTHLGLDEAARGAGIYEVLTAGLPLDQAMHDYGPNVTVVPAHIDLAAAETELVSVVGREVILRDALAGGQWPFDAVLIDCPPSLGVLTLNALSAATRALIPMQPHFLALQGVGKLLDTVSLVTQRINRGLRVLGMVVCLYESGPRLSGEVIEDVTSFLDSSRAAPVPWREAVVLRTRVRRNVKLAESPSYGQSIFEYAPTSHGAADYLALADEVMGLLWPGEASGDGEAQGEDEARGDRNDGARREGESRGEDDARREGEAVADGSADQAASGQTTAPSFARAAAAPSSSKARSAPRAPQVAAQAG